LLYIFTDGSAHPNPGPGGFGVIVLDKDKNLCHNNYTLVEVYTKQFDKTTNNEQELKAILYSFLKYGVKPNSNNFAQTPIIYSDSAYAINCLTTWCFTWAKNNWIKSDKKVPENLELIKAFYNHWQNGYRIILEKVRGHQGEKWNEYADKLATGKLTPENIIEMEKNNG
jgi:ribonuclease HI